MKAARDHLRKQSIFAVTRDEQAISLVEAERHDLTAQQKRQFGKNNLSKMMNNEISFVLFSFSCDTSVGIFGTLPVFVASVGTYSYTLDSGGSWTEAYPLDRCVSFLEKKREHLAGLH